MEQESPVFSRGRLNYEMGMKMSTAISAFFPPVGLLGFIIVPVATLMMVGQFASDFSTPDFYPTYAVKRVEVSPFGDRLQVFYPEAAVEGVGYKPKKWRGPMGDMTLALRDVRVSEAPSGRLHPAALSCLARSLR